MQGIYKITNINDGRVYIGRSVDIEERWKEHLKELENGTHHSYKLQECYDDLENKEDLIFEVVEEIEERWKLPAAEQYYMNKYDAYEKGFNCSPFADNPKYTSAMGYKMKEPFVWFQYQLQTPIFSQLKNATVTRLMYMATFLGSNGYLIHDNNKTLKKKQLIRIMGMKDSIFNSFWHEITINDIVYVKDDKIFLNDEYFSKGKLYKLKKASYVRLMVNGNRELYKSSIDLNAHKKISYVYKAIPYINKEWNELCFNQDEQEQEFIKSMKISTFGELIGYNTSNIRRCARELSSFQIQSQPIIKYTEDKRLIVNPSLYYAGTALEEIEYNKLDSILL